MRYYTHLAFSFFVGLWLIKYLKIENQILFIFLFLFFSLIPDIDETKSKIAQKTKALSWLINLFFSHRGLFHAVYIPILLFLLLFNLRMDIAVAVSFGYFSHIILDCFTVSGIRLLWPLKKRLKGFVRTGGWFENIVFVLFLGLSLYFLVFVL